MKVIDLFAGAGGLGEGFYNAGFSISASIDNNTHCLNTLRTRALYRYFKKINEQEYFKLITSSTLDHRTELYNTLFNDNKIKEKVLSLDLSKTFDKNVRKELISIEKDCDVIIGGPPCQAYSLINTKTRNKSSDIRHVLFKNYLHIIDIIKPKVFLFENVVGMTSSRINGKNIIQLFEDDLKKMKTKYLIISKRGDKNDLSYNRNDYIYDMSTYGIPQKRRRFILVAVRKDIYKKHNKNDLCKKFFSKKEYETFTVKNAIGDLPKINALNKRGEDIYLKNKVRKKSGSLYSKSLYMNYDGVFNHRSRTHMKQDLERYKFLASLKKNDRVSNTMKLFKDKRPDLLPEHKNLSSFVDRFKVHYSDSLAHTIMAHISKDGHYYIHYDPKQNRSLTVREAARIQSFSDNYFFEGPRTEQFKMVGNAVPPVFTRILAEKIMDIIKI